MAYNLLCESDKAIPWEELNRRLPPFTAVELVPMPGLGNGGGDALGLSVPRKNVGETAWRELCAAIDILREEFQLTLYDLYDGVPVGPGQLEKIREAIS